MNSPARSVVFQDIASAIGRDSARKLIEALGGSRIFVPEKIEAGHPIAKAIGLEPARLLSHYYHGTWWSLPVSASRQREVKRLADEGHTKQQIALATGYSERQVYRILGEDGDGRQGGLFEPVTP